MKPYWTIPGPKRSPRSHCIAFYKHDGTCIRAEWSRKNGWDKFGSRTVLIDSSSQYGQSIDIFKRKYAQDLDRILKKSKKLKSAEKAVAYLEYFGPHSFAGWHDPQDEKEMDLMLFDLNIHKRGILLPRDFIEVFEGEVEIPKVVYEGNFSQQFIEDVRDGKYPVKEGVVAKGVLNGKGQHSLWMSKAKTRWWFDELKNRTLINPDIFARELSDNLFEQGDLDG